MRLNKSLIILLLWFALVISDTAAQLLLKKGAMNGKASGDVLNYFILGGYSLYIVSFVSWMQILKTTRLFIALSTASVLYITVAFASHFYMGEIITTNIIIGTVLISAGVFLLGIGKKGFN
jgi:drug/metabolite transporter (DMT)-like permease